MIYPESETILDKVNKAKKILLSCHHHPDSDTVASATVLSSVFKGMGKETKVICPDDIPSHLKFISGSDGIEKERFEKYDFSEWDLFVICDTSNWDRIYIDKEFEKPKVEVIVIDNHKSNKGFGDLNLIALETSSVSEMIFDILSDWNIPITKEYATSLFAGISGDTGSFRFELYKRTFDVADKLVNLGADTKTVNYNLFDTRPLKLLKFLAVVIKNVNVDPKGFCYSAISYDEYKEFTDLFSTREIAATEIIARIEGTSFGFVMTEEAPKSTSISFRSRSGVDTSKIAVALGGGGHPAASGAWIQGKPFNEVLDLVLDACRNV